MYGTNSSEYLSVIQITACKHPFTLQICFGFPAFVAVFSSANVTNCCPLWSAQKSTYICPFLIKYGDIFFQTWLNGFFSALGRFIVTLFPDMLVSLYRGSNQIFFRNSSLGGSQPRTPPPPFSTYCASVLRNHACGFPRFPVLHKLFIAFIATVKPFHPLKHTLHSLLLHRRFVHRDIHVIRCCS